MLPDPKKLPRVLVADDDFDDRLLLAEAFQCVGFDMEVRFVENGEELLDSIRNAVRPLPDLILLDLNMPVMDGREALRLIKTEPRLYWLPVVILTTSRAEKDIAEAWASGANAYISKPSSYNDMMAMVKSLCKFWFEACSLPTETRS